MVRPDLRREIPLSRKRKGYAEFFLANSANPGKAFGSPGRLQKNFISYNISKIKLQDHTNIYKRELKHILRMPFSYL